MSVSAEQNWLLAANSGRVRDFFAEIGVELADNGSDDASVRCFANTSAHTHEDRNPSCSVNLVNAQWHCWGCGERGNAYRAAQLSGLSDRAAALLAQRFGLFLSVEKDPREKPKLPGERELKKWRHTLWESPAILARLRELKGWEPWACARLGLGWDGERLTFPIRSSRFKIVGVVRYLPGGNPKSKAVPGSKRDLFPPPELIRKHHPLFVVEGEGDAVAVCSLGFKVTAVPGAGSWRPEWAQRLVGRRIVVLSDCDQQGRLLAARIGSEVAGARVIDLEPGRDDGWDVGAMLVEARAEGGMGQLRRVLERLAA